MSLSPLSEGGELAELHQPSQLPFPGPGYMYPGTWGTWPGYQDQTQQYHQYHQYPAYTWGDTADYSHYTQYTEDQARKDRAKKKFEGRNPLTVIIDNVLKIVETELKQILKKDINKRICETYAFLLFDNWWTEQEGRYKERQEREAARLRRSEPTPAVLPPNKDKVADLPRIPKPEDLTSLIDKRRANLDNKGANRGGGSLGLGFRGTIPKLAQVQRKPRSPSPGGGDQHGEIHRNKEKEKGKDRSPKKKERDREKERERDNVKKKEREKEKSPLKESKSTVKSVYKDIYGDSESGDNQDEDESSDSSSDVVSSDDESGASKSSESEESKTEESEAEDDSQSNSSKSGSRSPSHSKSRSRSGSPSDSR